MPISVFGAGHDGFGLFFRQVKHEEVGIIVLEVHRSVAFEPEKKTPNNLVKYQTAATGC